MAQDEEQHYGYIYDLTPYTRTLNDDRRVAWNGFDVRRRHVKVAIISALIALMVSMFMLVPFGSAASVGSFFMVFPIPFALIEGQQTGDMRLRYWRVLYDKQASNVGKFILCNRIIDPSELRTGVIRSSSVPVRRPEKGSKYTPRASFDSIFDAPSEHESFATAA